MISFRLQLAIHHAMDTAGLFWTNAPTLKAAIAHLPVREEMR